jgi:glycerol-3-phosphate dehydrogenase (NAD(P)+)
VGRRERGEGVIARVAVLGGGAWGTALALTAARAGRDVALWARDGATVAAVNRRSENPRYLPGVTLAPRIRATETLADAAGADAIVLAVPAQEVGNVAAMLTGVLTPGAPVVIAAKGIERSTGKRLSEVLADVLPNTQRAVLSGPSFALDVARGLPTAVTIAARDSALALALCHAFSGASFRPYAETDVIGVEIGGAVKNVLAIAAGVVAGAGLGASAQAALTARGFAELRRFGAAHGAHPETLMGLSGLGDLVLTCSSPQSRNFNHGRAIGERGASPRSPHALVEGIATAAIVSEIARRREIAMPISVAVAAVLEGTTGVAEAVESLMNRPLRAEADGRAEAARE